MQSKGLFLPKKSKKALEQRIIHASKQDQKHTTLERLVIRDPNDKKKGSELHSKVHPKLYGGHIILFPQCFHVFSKPIYRMPWNQTKEKSGNELCLDVLPGHSYPAPRVLVRYTYKPDMHWTFGYLLIAPFKSDRGLNSKDESSNLLQ